MGLHLRDDEDGPKLTVEEYLAIEREAECKSEYYRGEMFAMAGGTGNHSDLAGCLNWALRNRLAGRACKVYNSDMKVQIEPGGLNTYPDLSVVCCKPVFSTPTKEALINPKLIVEVLSRSTEANDRGFKFQEYKKIASLEEYVLVSQTAPLIEFFGRRPGAAWTDYSEARGMGARLELKSLNIELSLEEIYREIELQEWKHGCTDPQIDR